MLCQRRNTKNEGQHFSEPPYCFTPASTPVPSPFSTLPAPARGTDPKAIWFDNLRCNNTEISNMCPPRRIFFCHYWRLRQKWQKGTSNASCVVTMVNFPKVDVRPKVLAENFREVRFPSAKRYTRRCHALRHSIFLVRYSIFKIPCSIFKDSFHHRNIAAVPLKAAVHQFNFQSPDVDAGHHALVAAAIP
jgi:hypothetical protein